MSRRSVRQLVLRERAVSDANEAVDHYALEAPAVAVAFVDALERAFEHIRRMPASGSPRYAHELDIPGLRSWPCGRYPHLICYFERSDRIEVWRVLHMSRDIPAVLREVAPGDMPLG